MTPILLLRSAATAGAPPHRRRRRRTGRRAPPASAGRGGGRPSTPGRSDGTGWGRRRCSRTPRGANDLLGGAVVAGHVVDHTTPPCRRSSSGMAWYASISSPSWPAIVIVSARIVAHAASVGISSSRIFGRHMNLGASPPPQRLHGRLRVEQGVPWPSSPGGTRPGCRPRRTRGRLRRPGRWRPSWPRGERGATGTSNLSTKWTSGRSRRWRSSVGVLDAHPVAVGRIARPMMLPHVAHASTAWLAACEASGRSKRCPPSPPARHRPRDGRTPAGARRRGTPGRALPTSAGAGTGGIGGS